jgi:hypothetical protein
MHGQEIKEGKGINQSYQSFSGRMKDTERNVRFMKVLSLKKLAACSL